MVNIFADIPENLSKEVFENIVESKNLKIERIVSKGHHSPPTGWYEQIQSEWVMVLKGEAIIAFENEPSVTLGEGDYLNIGAHKKHKVAWTTPEKETIWLAVHY